VKIEKISNIKGMATKTAEAFVEKIPQFIEFMSQAGLSDKLVVIAVEKKPANTSHELFGKSIIITGFRDNSLQEKLTEVGAKIGSVVSSKTFAVLVKNKDEDTGKANNARQLGIPLMTPEELISKYSL
jgi:DNA ligase (NAD+)